MSQVVMHKFSFFLFLFVFVRGSIYELSEALRAIPHTKSYVETLQTNESVTRTMIDTSSRFLRLVFDRQAELIAHPPGDDDDDATFIDSWKPERKISEEYLMAYITGSDEVGFSEFLSSITNLSLTEELEYLIESVIIQKFERRIEDYRRRIFRFKSQAVSILESAESQTVVMLQRFGESEFALMKSIVAKERKREKILAVIERNKRIVEYIGMPVLPAIRTGFSLSPRFSETAHIITWQSAIDNALALTDSPPDIVDRIKAIIRKLPTNQINEARKYVERKLVKVHENEIAKIDCYIAEKRLTLHQLKIEQTNCLGIYTTIVVDQTWFAQIL